MNGYETARLVNFVLIPRWMHTLTLLPSDKTFHRIDTMISEFVHQGMDTARTITSWAPQWEMEAWDCGRDGGLGLQYIYWAYRR